MFSGNNSHWSLRPQRREFAEVRLPETIFIFHFRSKYRLIRVLEISILVGQIDDKPENTKSYKHANGAEKVGLRDCVLRLFLE